MGGRTPRAGTGASGSRRQRHPAAPLSKRDSGAAALPRARSSLPSVRLAAALRPSLAKGHPWIYRDHLPARLELPTGSWVSLECDGWTGIGIYDAESAIAIRVFSRKEEPDEAWLARRVQWAWARRRPLLESGQTNAYRLLNGEGDALPGLVVDVYGTTAVLRLDSNALTPLIPWLTRSIRAVTGAKGVCMRNREGLATLDGSPPPRQLIVSEHGIRFFADLRDGQKTGLFLDHRENRKHVEPWCEGRSVLNVFSYTGGFSLYAARGGARRVVSVDRSPEVMARARDNVALNDLNATSFEFLTEDAFRALERMGEEGQTFDVVITDPPSFARNRTQRKRAQRAYEKLHSLSLQVLSPGGLYAAGSCTTQIGVDAFRDTLATAAARSERQLQIALESGQPLDHPMMVGHPEGRYLKFMALRAID